MIRLWKTGLILLTVASACSDPTDPAPANQPNQPSSPGRPTLRVVSGADASDTIQATLAADLVVELTDQSGRPWAGAMIEFRDRLGIGLLVATSGTDFFRFVAYDTTDSAGRASVRVKFGTQARSTQVFARMVPDTTLNVAAPLTVLPGAVARLRVTPEDTTLYLGKTFTLRGTSADRLGNAQSDVIRYSSLTTTTVRVDESGSAETLAVGRALVLASVGTFADTVFVSVPPEGVITAMRLGPESSARVRIVTINLDGSSETTRVTSQFWSEAGFSWSPGGSALVFALGDHDTSLFQQTTAGVAPFLRSAPALQSLAFPRHSRDGAWVYFNGRPGHQNSEIWRARSDGTVLERIGPLADDYAVDVSPDPSPDGTRVVYSTGRVNSTMPVIRMITLNPRVITPLDVPGVTPRWLPDGSAVAYVTTKPSWGYLDDHRMMNSYGFLSLMNPDGSNQRLIPTGTKQWYAHFDVSADGKWILARSESRVLELVEIATGVSIPLTYSQDLLLAMWKP